VHGGGGGWWSASWGPRLGATSTESSIPQRTDQRARTELTFTRMGTADVFWPVQRAASAAATAWYRLRGRAGVSHIVICHIRRHTLFASSRLCLSLVGSAL
jgi:hypothetical protein